MALRHVKPTTSSQRQLVQVNYEELSKVKPERSLMKGLSYSGGRNNKGRLTAFRKGGGHKRRYRLVDFKRSSFSEAIVVSIEYDPNRSAFIAKVRTELLNFHYILAPLDLKVGDIVESGTDVPINIGNALPLRSIPVGTIVHNIELKPGHGGQYARSAGTFGVLIQKDLDGKYAQIRLKSKEQRLVPLDCMATIGVVSNPDHGSISISKAGRSRWLGRRPTVRGVAMNPVDHPHGGGEGKTSGGRPSVSPWGKLTKGPKTRSPKKKSDLILQKRKR
jgi:large subunit ribosomal protein L2|tara:strand:- start:1514 stop:2341 length:828 start_codon:yes stop_codon:yes gene_type:complete